MAATRAQLSCPVYGIGSELTSRQLPTVQEVMQYYSFLKTQLPKTTKSREIVVQVSTDITDIWIKSGIPTVSMRRVQQKVESLHDTLRTILKRKGEAKVSAVLLAKQDSLSLFDIAACHCLDFSSCTCPRKSKVPELERQFLLDQRNERNMVIGPLDKETTSKLTKGSERATKRQKYYDFLSCSKSSAGVSGGYSSDTDLDMDDMDVSGDENNDNYDQLSEFCESESESGRNLMKFPTVARECDRYGVSDAAGAAIATAALTDYGIIKEHDRTAIIDRAKLRRQRQQLRATLSQEAKSSMSSVGPKAIFFDGRKDKTLCATSVSSKGFITEEHITLIEEPYSIFLGHISPSSGSSANIKNAIIDFFNENQTSLDNVLAIGADGTNVNTGVNNGAIRLLELHMGHPVQWLICMFHFNELPLRHLVLHLDGTTSGPTAFSGTIGKALAKCHDLSIVKFEARQNNLPSGLHDVADLAISKDQQYLYNICKAIEIGEVTDSLAKKEPGPLVHSRWLTTANRILRLYVASTSLSTELVLLTDYVLRVYAPVWFYIKLEPQCYMGARHLWRLIQLSRFLSETDRLVVDKCIQRNAFFGHPENILISMLVDDRKEIRELAARRIKLSRQSPVADYSEVRKFRIPPLNFDAEDYHSLVNWQELPRTQPPMLKDVSDDEIEKAIQIPQKWTLDDFPCHTQSVERHVKMVTEAAASVCGDMRRDGYIRAKILSRKCIPHFGTKKDWRI